MQQLVIRFCKLEVAKWTLKVHLEVHVCENLLQVAAVVGIRNSSNVSETPKSGPGNNRNLFPLEGDLLLCLWASLVGTCL